MLVFPIVHLFSIFAGIKKKKIRKLYWFLFYVLMLIVKKSVLLASIAEPEGQNI